MGCNKSKPEEVAVPSSAAAVSEQPSSEAVQLKTKEDELKRKEEERVAHELKLQQEKDDEETRRKKMEEAENEKMQAVETYQREKDAADEKLRLEEEEKERLRVEAEEEEKKQEKIRMKERLAAFEKEKEDKRAKDLEAFKEKQRLDQEERERVEEEARVAKEQNQIFVDATEWTLDSLMPEEINMLASDILSTYQVSQSIAVDMVDDAAALSEQKPPAVKAGYIKKQGHGVKNWKRRYCVLDCGVLQYYESSDVNGGKNKKGDFKLANSVISRLLPGMVGSNVYLKTPEGMVAAGDKADFVMDIENLTLRDEWLIALEQHITYATNAKR